MAKTLEDESPETLWQRYRQDVLPPDEILGENAPFILEQLRQAYFAGSYTMVVFEGRCRKEKRERTEALFDRYLAELEISLGRPGAH